MPGESNNSPSAEGSRRLSTRDLEALAERHLDPDALAYFKEHLQGYFKGVTPLDTKKK
ncbi:MAG: hypothetical protein ACFE0O_05110 [Opitutales bacterium]